MRNLKSNPILFLIICIFLLAAGPSYINAEPKAPFILPMAGDIIVMFRLENWSIAGDLSDPYKAPELAYRVLQGEVYDHPGFKEGTLIHTSRLIQIEVRENDQQGGISMIV